MAGPPKPAPQENATEEPPIENPYALKNNSGVWVRLGGQFINHNELNEKFFKKHPELAQEYNNIRANPQYKDVFKDIDAPGFDADTPGNTLSDKAYKLASTIGGAFIEANLPKNIGNAFLSFRRMLDSTLGGDLLGAVGAAVDHTFNALTILGDGAESFKNKVKQNYGYSPGKNLGEGVKAILCKRETEQVKKAMMEEVTNMVQMGDVAFGYKGRKDQFHEKYFPKGYDKAKLNELGMEQSQADKLDKLLGYDLALPVAGANGGYTWGKDSFSDDEKKDLVYMLKTGDYGYNKELMGRFIRTANYQDPAKRGMGWNLNPYSESVKANQTYDFSANLGDWSKQATAVSPEEGLRRYYNAMCKKRAELVAELEADRLGFKPVYKDDGSGEMELDANGNPRTEPVERMSARDRRVLTARMQAYDQAIKGMESGSGGILKNEIALQSGRITAEQKALRDIQDAKIKRFEANPTGGAYQILAQRKDGDIQYSTYFMAMGLDVPDNVKVRGSYMADKLYARKKEIENKFKGMSPERIAEIDSAYASVCNAYAVIHRGGTLYRQLAIIDNSDAENKEKLREDLLDEYTSFVKDRPWEGQHVDYKPYTPVNLVTWGRENVSQDIGDKDVGPQDIRSIFPSSDIQGTIQVDAFGNVQYLDMDGNELSKSAYNLVDDTVDSDRMEGLRGIWDQLESKYQAGIPMTDAEHREYAALKWLRANQLREEARAGVKKIINTDLLQC